MSHVRLHVGLQSLRLVDLEGYIRATQRRAHNAGVEERVCRVVLGREIKNIKILKVAKKKEMGLRKGSEANRE